MEKTFTTLVSTLATFIFCGSLEESNGSATPATKPKTASSITTKVKPQAMILFEPTIVVYTKD